jgi:hypothetical protein
MDKEMLQLAAAASKLLRAYAVQIETLRWLRGVGSQYVRVEHVQRTSGHWEFFRKRQISA